MSSPTTTDRIVEKLRRLDLGIRPITVVKLALLPLALWLLHTFWFAGGVGVATWKLMREMYADPRAFSAGIFALAVGVLMMRLTLRAMFWRPHAVQHAAKPIGPALFATAAGSTTTDPIPADVRRETAEHEAAHIVASIERRVDVTEVMVRRHFPAGRRGLMGRVSNPPLNLSTPSLATPEQWYDRMVILLAGHADDTRRGRSIFGSMSDCDQAHEIATMLYRYRTMPGAESADDLFDWAMAEAHGIVADHAALIDELAGLILEATTDSDTVPADELVRIIDTATPMVPIRGRQA